MEKPIEIDIPIVTENVLDAFKLRMYKLGIDVTFRVTKLTNKNKAVKFMLRVNTLPKIITKRLKTDNEIHSLVCNILLKQIKVDF